MELTIKQQMEVMEAAELSADCPYDLAVEFADWGIHFYIQDKANKSHLANMSCFSAELALPCARTMKKLAEDDVAALQPRKRPEWVEAVMNDGCTTTCSGVTGEEVCHE